MARTAFTILFLLGCMPAFSWGFFAHERINRYAVFTLPADLMVFYKQHLELITEHAVDPDKRRYAVDNEAQRHYIDIDHYGDTPFETVPHGWSEAVETFSEDTLQAYGIVPWHVNAMYHRLVQAFKEKDIPRILRLSADLGHYIADAHVPLHTTENYNGQLTGQRGIHGFWESRLPELFAENYDYVVGRAFFIDDPLGHIWHTVEASHIAVDSVLLFEKKLSAGYPLDRKYGFEQRGRSTVKTYSRSYAMDYDQMLSGMVERRMRAAIISVGSYWYSAWLEAGQPDLSTPLSAEAVKMFQQEREELEAKYRQGAVKGRGCE